MLIGAKIHKKDQNDPNSTSQIARNHVIEISDSGLVSLMGGKWASFRKMGEETVDEILKNNQGKFSLKYLTTQTKEFSLVGSYSKNEVL